jgi:hypothetical protein
MRTATGQALERLIREYRRKVAAVRADESLSWEKQELKVKALTDEHYRQCKELEEEDAV